jgi:hypothetical protein
VWSGSRASIRADSLPIQHSLRLTIIQTCEKVFIRSVSPGSPRSVSAQTEKGLCECKFTCIRI